KHFNAQRTDFAPRIDGKLDEVIWKSAEPAKDFLQYAPFNGQAPHQPTEVRIVYDDRAIYIGAMMYDEYPDSIYRELGERDPDHINADFFTVDIVPYDDGLNAFEFKVYASGVEGDVKHAANYNDENWDPIWKSAVEVNDSGWVAEIEIPYAALRFPKKPEQVWGINFWREIRRHREFSTWNYIDNTLDGVFNQSGTVGGIRDIKPPLRLFFIPYVAGYTEKLPESETWAYSYNYGMDLKLGLSESFTLDMTLIPDFGQVQSDDKIKNLSPFEVYYQERRPFFTEGTELFDRGEIFYTRRIGGTPDGYYDLRNEYSSDSIIENPEEIQLLNATKISGRNKKGFAVGVMNAVTANAYARVLDSSGTEQRVLTNPASNFNMLVFDQNLKNNSYVSLYNTNFYQGRDRYIANVSGTEFEVRNKKDMYSVAGRLNISQKYYPDQKTGIGYSYGGELGKISGNFRYKLSHYLQNDTYEINDMGFNPYNNRIQNELELEYNIYKPVGKLIDMHNELAFQYNLQYNPREFRSFSIESSNRTTWVNYLTTGFNWELMPVEYNDFYEPRVDGWVLKRPANGDFSFFLSPDYRKRFVMDFSTGVWASNKYYQSGYRLRLKPRLRISDRFSMILEVEYDKDFNDLGHVTDSLSDQGDQVIIIGKRDVRTVETILDAKYIFTKNIALTLRARHYWITAEYDEFFRLQESGYLEHSDYWGEYDFIYNAFNIDMVFRWTFAPASELIFVWKNNIYSEKSEIINDYIRNLQHTFNAPMGNSFSLKVLYYLDYHSLRRKNRKL
ncbi:MAG TPA: DUF5916 domain-containing protein, partial [Bacteroidales bacterium]|nr:DUF5916 domain-containing protein [Bacteroidales bacterium]